MNHKVKHKLTCKAYEKVGLVTVLNTYNFIHRWKLICLHCFFIPSW